MKSRNDFLDLANSTAELNMSEAADAASPGVAPILKEISAGVFEMKLSNLQSLKINLKGSRNVMIAPALLPVSPIEE